MNFSNALYIMLVLLMNNMVHAQEKTLGVGINLTGYEQFWDDKTIDYKDVILDIDKLYSQGIRDIRLPVAFEYQFENDSKRHFIKDLIKIVKHIKKKDMTLIVCYFDHTLDKETNYTNVNTIKSNWKYISKKLKKYSKYVYYEIVNEPNLYPIQWDAMVHDIVSTIRKEDPKTKILIGATNYNSIYELSRKKPFPYKNIVYTFHFYEPFIFTHQGANWIGNQTKTEHIPYPYDSIKMPKMDLKAVGTAGEINYKDYKDMANKIALGHKIDIVSRWAKEHHVEVWCTEFGTIKSIAPAYRYQYFKDVLEVFKTRQIPCYLWEYKGNFGIDKTNDFFRLEFLK